MRVACSQCSAKYNISDAALKGRRVKIRCKRCGERILIDGRTQSSTEDPIPRNSATETPEQKTPTPQDVPTPQTEPVRARTPAVASPEQDSGRKDSGASDVPQSKLSAATRASSQRPDREARAAAAKQATRAAPQPISARNVLEGNKPATSSKPLPVQHDVPVDKVPPTTPSHQTPAKEQSSDGRNQ